jgi:hypothetical protein
MKMELIESSETSASNTQTPGTYPKESILLLKVNNFMSKHLLQLCSSKVCDQFNLRIMLNCIIEMFFGKISPCM